MLVIILIMVVIVALAALVVTYVAYPHRGEEVPNAPWLGEAMARAADAAPTLPTEGDPGAEAESRFGLAAGHRDRDREPAGRAGGAGSGQHRADPAS